jgi:amino acid adenylation domain-containing protein
VLTDPFDPSRTLIEIADLHSGTAGADLSTARAVIDWAREYLCTGHAELGRRGHVCPFAKTALDGGTFYVNVQSGTPERAEDVAEMLLGYRDWFARLSIKDGSRAQWNTILVAFPDLAGDDVHRVIDGTQQLLKAEYVARGLMIGEFHDGPPDKAGLWNPDFRPLRSPVPLLAIRNMVPTDFPFLRDDPEYVGAYLSRFSDEVPAHLREQVAAAVEMFGLTPAPRPVGAVVPLSPAQRRRWFLSRMDPGNAVHNVARAFRLTGTVRPDLADSLAAIVRRHPALRITLAEQDGQPVATVADNAETTLAVLDVANEVEAERAARKFARRPFDIRRGPLLRGLLIRLSAQDHVLVLAAHRIAADEAAMDLICDELGGIVGDVLAPADQVSSPADLEYWTRRLAGAPTLDLPVDGRRPPMQSYRGATHRFRLPVGGTFEMLLAAFTIVLSRHSGQTDIVVGCQGDTTAVLRTDLSGNPTFQQLVGSCAAGIAEASDHANVAFEDVVAALDIERNLAVPPVFQARLVVRERPPAVPRLADVAVAELPLDLATTDVDLTLRARPGADGTLDLALEYNTDLYEPETIRRLADHLVAVTTADVSIPVNEIPLLTEQERVALMRDRQGVTIELPDPATPLTLLAHGLARDPDALAVRAADGDLSYSDLYRRASQLAHLLRAWGAGPDVPVGVCVERSASMVVALLGVWFAGAAYVPLDPGFPIDRLRLMLADAGAEVVVTHGPAQERVDDLLAETAGVINLDDDADVLAAQPDTQPDNGPQPDDLAYVIYTSGSTGRPKGVEIPHRAVANLLVAFDRVLPLSGDDRWLAVTTLSFDIAVLELFHPLASGAQVVVASRPETEDGLSLRQRAISSGATVMQSTPATWRMLLAAGGVPPGIRARLCGGEAVPRDLAGELAVDGATVWNVYGPTETTVWSAAGVIIPDAPIQIGPPIANTTVDVLDASGSPVPVGVVGQIHIGGLGLARGYRNMPALTKQRFITDPARPGSRLYATGDLARYRRDGMLEFLGRADQQVKVRGFRIELGEIESVLRAHESVDAAVVTTWRGEGDDHRLVAYLVGDISWPELEAWLRRSLPGYMVPSAVVTLDELPLTPNGKVDRAALPSPTWGGQISERRPPRNAIERALVELWRDVLGLTDIGVDDDFFSLGGHSLLGARLLARVRAYFDIEVSVRSLFEAPTAAGFAAVLERLEPEPGYAETIAQLRQRIDAMPDDQVEALLGQST